MQQKCVTLCHSRLSQWCITDFRINIMVIQGWWVYVIAYFDLCVHVGIETFGKNAVVCGRSKNVGLPIALLLHADGAGETEACQCRSSLCSLLFVFSLCFLRNLSVFWCCWLGDWQEGHLACTKSCSNNSLHFLGRSGPTSNSTSNKLAS